MSRVSAPGAGLPLPLTGDGRVEDERQRQLMEAGRAERRAAQRRARVEQVDGSHGQRHRARNIAGPGPSLLQLGEIGGHGSWRYHRPQPHLTAHREVSPEAG